MLVDRLEICAFSGQKIYPGRGALFVRGDSRAFRLLNGKCEAHFLKKKNPRKFHWTVVYRRLHKKGTTETVQKKRTRRVIKSVRGIEGASSDLIKAKRSQPAEVRTAARMEALNADKAKKKEQQQKKKQEKVKSLASMPAQKSKAPKVVKAAKPMARSR